MYHNKDNISLVIVDSKVLTTDSLQYVYTKHYSVCSTVPIMTTHVNLHVLQVKLLKCCNVQAVSTDVMNR